MDARLMDNQVSPPGAPSPAPRRASGAEEEAEARDSVPPMDLDQFNFPRTFAFMTSRRLQRRYRGVYKKYSFVSQVVTWIMAVYVLAVLATLAVDNSASVTETASLSDGIFYCILGLIVIYIIVKIALVIQWLVYWVIVAEMVTYAATGNMHALFWFDDTISSSERKAVHIIIIVLACIEIITLIAYMFTHFTYPWLVQKQKLDPVDWWNIKPGKETNTLTYRSKARFYSKERRTVKYCGGLNALGQPHGYGMWTDTAYHGERLTGQWEDGIPVGPFRSFEHGSGYSFVNIRVGFCHNRGEKGPTDIFFWPRHSEDSNLHWGVASVECSVSGGFFRFLPTVTHLTKSFTPESPQSAKDLLPVLRTPTDGVVFTHDGSAPARENTELPRKKTRRHFFFHEKSAPVLDLSDSAPEKEALVLLHGYNCSLNYSMNRLAQLLCLGDFPSHIHPYVFSWPSGGVLAYFQAKVVGSESDRTSHDFHAFVQSLIDAGYTKLNIIAHSMGARVFTSCLNKRLLDDVLVSANPAVPRSTPGKIRLSTLTFVNPDYERNDFARYGGVYDRARQFCEHITLYADNMDGALYYIEFLSKESVFGPLNYSLGKRGYMMYRDPVDSTVAGRTDSEFRDWAEKDLTPQEDLDHAYALVNQQGNYPGVATFAYNRTRMQSTEPAEHAYGTTRADVAADAPKQYLDMDVIDTTWMDNNVHAIRHNYFNINPTIVDDLRHLIVHKKRASSRPGLLKTTSAENVYIFLVAPAHVKNK